MLQMFRIILFSNPSAKRFMASNWLEFAHTNCGMFQKKKKVHSTRKSCTSLQPFCDYWEKNVFFNVLFSIVKCRKENSSLGKELTWIFAPFIPLDEAENEKDQQQKHDGAHNTDEPTLCCKALLHLCHFFRDKTRRKQNIYFCIRK